MCLLVFYVNPSANDDSSFYLILVNVRDEIYNRPTKIANFWDKQTHVIGGMDMERGKEGGTWLAMSKKGKIAALLNILQPDDEILPNKKGRGFLVSDYVVSDSDSLSYLEKVNDEKEEYNGFLLVTMDFRLFDSPKLGYVTNAGAYFSSTFTTLNPGFHAFGNSVAPSVPWPKVAEAKKKFTDIVNKHPATSSKDDLVKELFSLLRDSTRYTLDDNMRKQGKSKSAEFLEKLSAVFVQIPEANYGSRCHTIILIDGSGNVDYFESNRNEDLPPEASDPWSTEHFSFRLFS